MRLTAKDRILLHLLEFVKYGDSPEVPPSMTQVGIALASWIDDRHIPQNIRPLIQEGLVRERTAHVQGGAQRRKVYDLTDSGRLVAIRLRDAAKGEKVRARDSSGIIEVTLAEFLARTGGQMSLLETLRLSQAGVLDIPPAGAKLTTAFVEMLADAPRTERFVGREQELADVTAAGAKPRIFVIRGVAGIGKSAFAAQACARVRGSRNLFWHQIRPWDTPQSVLMHLGEFLVRLGRPGLHAVLVRGDASRALEALRGDLAGTQSFLVFDDAHEASPELLPFLRLLKDAAVGAQDVRVLILTRRKLAFYDRRDVSVQGNVREIDLPGLRRDEVTSFLADHPQDRELHRVSLLLGGHPLFLQLIRSSGRPPAAEVRGDVRRFVEEAIYQELTGAERRMLKLACLYQVPVPEAAILAGPSSDYDTLLSLVDRALVMRVGEDAYQVHDTVQEVIRALLTEAEAAELGTLARRQLREFAAQEFSHGDFVSCANHLSNAIALSQDARERARIWGDLGDARDRMGDLPAALVAYREALRLAAAGEFAAELRRKIATALQGHGENEPAAAEVAAAFNCLESRDSVERGWLNLVSCRISVASEAWREGRERAEAALQAFRSFQEVRGQTEALLEIANIQINEPRGDLSSTEKCLQEALERSESLADPSLTASVHVQFAAFYAYRLGDADRAMEHLRAVEGLPGALADARNRLSLLMQKGWFALDFMADSEAARAGFTDALVLAKKTYDPVSSALAKYGIGVTAFHTCDFGTARSQLEEAASELAAVGHPGYSVEALWVAAETCIVTGNAECFRRLAAAMRAPKLARGLEMRPVIGHVLAGMEYLLDGNRRGMHTAFHKAIELAEKEVSPQEWSLAPFAHDYYGLALDAMGEPGLAAQEVRQAVEWWQRLGLKGRLTLRVRLAKQGVASLRRMANVPAS